MKSLKDLLRQRDPRQRKQYITREFQDYGYRLAKQLNDEEHKSLYDISKAKKLLGYEPKIEFREGLERTVAWYSKKI